MNLKFCLIIPDSFGFKKICIFGYILSLFQSSKSAIRLLRVLVQLLVHVSIHCLYFQFPFASFAMFLFQCKILILDDDFSEKNSLDSMLATNYQIDSTSIRIQYVWLRLSLSISLQPPSSAPFILLLP